MATNGYLDEGLCRIDSEQRLTPLRADRFAGKKKNPKRLSFEEVVPRVVR